VSACFISISVLADIISMAGVQLSAEELGKILVLLLSV